MPSSVASNHLDTPLTNDELTQFDERLAHIGEHSENGLSLEGVDGFITALLCGPRLVMPSEYLPVLLGEAWMEVFPSADELEAFMSLFNRRWNQIAHALNAPVEDLSDPDALAPLIMDWEGLLADLPEDERERVEAEGVPPYASVWAAGFLLAVEHWEDDWLLPEGSQDETFVDELLDRFYILIEPPEDLTPEERELSRDEYVAMAIWSAYDLFAFWQDRGSAPRTPFKKAPEPGRNDPCPCGSGKKFKKCCGAADKLH